MGSKFKLQLQEIEEKKRNEGKSEIKTTLCTPNRGVHSTPHQCTPNTDVLSTHPIQCAPSAPTRAAPGNQSVYNLSNVSPPFQAEVKS